MKNKNGATKTQPATNYSKHYRNPFRGGLNLLKAFSICSGLLFFSFYGSLFLTSLSQNLLFQIQAETQKTMGGDLEIVSREALSTKDWKSIFSILETHSALLAKVVLSREFASMIYLVPAKESASELVEVRAFSGPHQAAELKAHFTFDSNGKSEDRTNYLQNNLSASFPSFYGALEFSGESSGEFFGEFFGDNSKGGTRKYSQPIASEQIRPIAVSETLANKKQLKIGDVLQLGEAQFTVVSFVKERTQALAQSLTVAPKVWILLKDLESTLLENRGSRVRYRALFQLEEKPQAVLKDSLNSLVDDLKAYAKTSTQDAFRIRAHHEGQPALRDLTENLSRFLTYCQIFLWALVAMALYFSIRGYLSRRRKTYSILKALGQTHHQILLHETLKIFLLMAGVCLSAYFCALISAYYFRPHLPHSWQSAFEINTRLFFLTATPLFTLAGLTSWFAFSPLKNISPVEILKDSTSTDYPQNGFLETSPRKTKLYLFQILKSFYPLLFYGLWLIFTSFILLGRSEFFSTIFLLILMSVVVLFFYFLLKLLLIRIARFFSLRGFLLRISVRSIQRRARPYTMSFLVLCLGMGFVFFLETLSHSIQREIQPDNPLSLPDLFVIDLLPSEIPSLKTQLHKMDINNYTLSPWYKGRLLAVNGKPFSETREDFVRTEINFTERDSLYPTEKIIDGSHWVTPWNPSRATPQEDAVSPLTSLSPPHADSNSAEPKSLVTLGVSVSSTYAKRTGIKVNDRLEIELSGISFLGIVKNIRSVRWSDFRPNFFFMFQSGFLTHAPATWIASIHWNSNGPQWQTFFRAHFPSATVFDLNVSIHRIQDLVRQVLILVRAISALGIFTAFLLLVLTQLETLKTRLKDFSLLYTLGLTKQEIYRALNAERILLIAMSFLVGMVICLTLSYFLVFQRMNIPVNLPLKSFSVIIFAFLIVEFFLGQLIKTTLKVRP